MQTNIIEKRKVKPIENRPVTVVCVVDDLGEKDDRLLKMREFCKINHVQFTMRVFDSIKYSEDCNNIHRLPAFHIKIKRNYQRTFYPNTRPYQHVLECIEIYEQRKDAYKNLMPKFYAWLTNCFKKTPTPKKVENLPRISIPKNWS